MKPKLTLKITHRNKDEPVQNVDLFERAWGELVELQVRPKQDFVVHSLLSLKELPRWEVSMHTPEGYCVGGVILAEDPWDPHVGRCLSVFAQYVVPEYRNLGVSVKCMRIAVQIAKQENIPVLAWTHRLGDWRYKTTYRRIYASSKN